MTIEHLNKLRTGVIQRAHKATYKTSAIAVST